MTSTTLYTNQHLTNGNVQLTETTLDTATTGFNVILKLEQLLPPSAFRSVRLRVACSVDVGTFNSTTLPYLLTLSSAIEVLGPLPDMSTTIRYYKIPLQPVEGTHVYTWLEVGNVAADEIQATAYLNEA